MPYRLLGCFAHPDDEILGPGATLAYYAQKGVTIDWIVTTRGEAGEIAPDSDATREDLAQVREREMRCAADKLGFRSVQFLDYRDSGMAGTPENDHPEAYVNSQDEDVVPLLVQQIREKRPHVILTFEPWGGYGHPDHVTIHRHTQLALTAAADPAYRPDLGAPWQTPRLFYPLLRTATFRALEERMTAQGLHSDFFAMLEERQEKGWPDDQFHCRIDVRHTFAKKWEAFHCHATQFGPDNLFRQLPVAEMADFWTHEYFAQAHPTPDADLLLDDLFAGLPEL